MWLLIISLLAFLSAIVYLERRYRRPYIDGFRSKTVFITGTDSGFGYELAINLIRHGVKVYAGCYTKEGAESLRKAATNDGFKVVNIDITNIESVIRAKEVIEEDLKQTGEELWGLVNNAGVFEGFTFALSTCDVYRRVMEVNFFGTINVTEIFLPLIKRSSGRIAIVNSMAGRVSGGWEPYACSKSSLEPYSCGLRRWMSNYKVHVSIIEPGVFTFTNIIKGSTLDGRFDEEVKRLPLILKEEYGEEVLNKMKKTILFSMKNPFLAQKNNRKMVPNAIKHALFAQHPKARYCCGFDALFLFRPAVFSPDFVTDFVLRRHFSICENRQ